jgi:hypothetical protein
MGIRSSHIEKKNYCDVNISIFLFSNYLFYALADQAFGDMGQHISLEDQ